MENILIDLTKSEDKILTFSKDESTYSDIGFSIEILPNNNYLLGIHEIDSNLYQEPHSYDYELEYMFNTNIFPIYISPDKKYQLTDGVEYIGFSFKTEIDKNGNIISNNITKNIIKLEKNFSYDVVNKILKNQKVSKEYNSYIHMIENLKELVDIYTKTKNKPNYFTKNERINLIQKEDYYVQETEYISPIYKLLIELYEIPFKADEILKQKIKKLTLN